MVYQIPLRIKMIMQKLMAEGYSAFVVGGAVRNLIIGKPPKDYDLTTDAKPEEIVTMAKKAGWKVIDQLGQNFGVVAVIIDGEAVEIATYRGECYGEDAHRPERVWRADTLIEDLSRRDFTFNAMALDIEGVLSDPFSGKEDLAKGLIRTVGLPEKRFSEDALRMFRACRFAAELGFEIDQGALTAMTDQLGRVPGLSLARVRTEIQRILVADCPSRGLAALVASGLAGCECRVKTPAGLKNIPILPELLHLVDMPQNPQFHKYDVWQHTLKAIDGVPNNLTLRWAALLHDVAKGLPGIRSIGSDGKLTDYGHDQKGAEMADEILQRFEYGKNFRQSVTWLISRHMRLTVWKDDLGPVWRWLRSEARGRSFRNSNQLAEAFRNLGELCLADLMATGTVADIKIQRIFVDILSEMAASMPVSTSDLEYDSATIGEILGGMDLLGPFLKNALQRVQDRNLDNSKAAMEAAARRWVIRHHRI